MSFIGALGRQMAGNAADGILGLAFGGIQNARQLKQQKKLNRLQIEGNKEMADYGQMKQLEMWEKTGYGAQKQQMMEAGLNPALMYGMGGGGGQSVGAGATGSVSGGAASGAGDVKMQGMGMQMALLDAQRKNIEMDTKKKEAEANATSGVQTDLAKKQIESLTQGIENAKAQEIMTQVQTRLARIEVRVAGATAEDRIDRVMWDLERAMSDAEVAFNEAYIARTTKDDKVKVIVQAGIAGVLKNALTSVETDLANQRIISEINDRVMRRLEYGLDVRKVGVDETRNEISKLLGEMNIDQREKEMILGAIENVIGMGSKLVPRKSKRVVERTDDGTIIDRSTQTGH